MARKPLYEMAAKVFSGLDKTVEDLRNAGVSWEHIARELWKRSEGLIDISGQTLRSWYLDAA